jgi:hypothetical protein
MKTLQLKSSLSLLILIAAAISSPAHAKKTSADEAFGAASTIATPVAQSDDALGRRPRMERRPVPSNLDSGTFISSDSFTANKKSRIGVETNGQRPNQGGYMLATLESPNIPASNVPENSSTGILVALSFFGMIALSRPMARKFSGSE